MTIHIRRLTPNDAAIYHPIRLAGLREHPAAFGADHDHEATFSLEVVAARLGEGVTWGAFIGSALVGVTSFYIQEGAKTRHKGMIVAVYVRPQARGSGAGRALMAAALDYARGKVELVQLGVGVGNASARRLYESCGFLPYGTEPHAYKLTDQYVDDLLMWRPL